MIRNVSFYFAAVALAVSAASAGAQTAPPESKLSKQLDHVDFGVSGEGLFNRSVTGTVDPKGTTYDQGESVTDNPSNTFGALITIRYIAKPLVGFEFNYGYARYTENFAYPATNASNFGVQTQADEFTLGYLVTPNKTFLGVSPFASVGAGSTEFKPTAHGGEGLPRQARMTYYYSAGVQDDISPHFGLRASFRQNFFLAPDFGQNYLTILRHTITTEPTVGFYLRF